MTPAGLERKVRQLDNDVSAAYDILGSIQTTQRRHTTRLDELAANQASMTATQAEHSATLEQHSATLSQILQLVQELRDAK